MRPSFWFLTAGVCTAALLASPTAWAQQGENPDTANTRPPGGAMGGTAGMKMAPGDAPTGKISGADRHFIEEAGATNLAEIQLGRLAADKGESPEVKGLGQKLVDDHTRANDQLKPLADARGITLPTEPSAAQRSTYERLSKLSGKDFDKAFLKEVQKGHDRSISLYKKEASSSHDADLKSYAEQTLPTLKTHTDTAKRDLKQM
jgi:putative membrane protein